MLCGEEISFNSQISNNLNLLSQIIPTQNGTEMDHHTGFNLQLLFTHNIF